MNVQALPLMILVTLIAPAARAGPGDVPRQSAFDLRDMSNVDSRRWEQILEDVNIGSSSEYHEPWLCHAALVARALRLTDDQSARLRLLLNKFDDDRRDVIGRHNEFRTEMYRLGFDSTDQRIVAYEKEARERFNIRRTELREKFETELKAMLTPEQVGLWPDYVHVGKRNMQVRWLSGTGRNANLVAIVGHAFPGRILPEGVAATLEVYERELEAIYRKIDHENDELDRSRANLPPAELEEQFQAKQLRVYEIGREIIRLNDRTLEKLSSAFETADADHLIDEFHMWAFHRGGRYVFSLAPIDQIRECVDVLSDITPDQRERFEAQWRAGMAKLRALRASQYKELCEKETYDGTVGIHNRAMNSCFEQELPIRLEMLRQFRPIFTPEQRATMPKSMHDVLPPVAPVFELEERP